LVVDSRVNPWFAVGLTDDRREVLERHRCNAGARPERSRRGACTVLDARACPERSRTASRRSSDDSDNASDVEHSASARRGETSREPAGRVPQGCNGEAGHNPFLFTGRRLDSEWSGMQYRNRSYSTTLGRFVSRDPAGHEDALCLYLYALDVPTRAGDPRGLLPANITVRTVEVTEKNAKKTGTAPMAFGMRLEANVVVPTFTCTNPQWAQVVIYSAHYLAAEPHAWETEKEDYLDNRQAITDATTCPPGQPCVRYPNQTKEDRPDGTVVTIEDTTGYLGTRAEILEAGWWGRFAWFETCLLCMDSGTPTVLGCFDWGQFWFWYKNVPDSPRENEWGGLIRWVEGASTVVTDHPYDSDTDTTVSVEAVNSGQMRTDPSAHFMKAIRAEFPNFEARRGEVARGALCPP
jgi:RHS repeat-associated protein